MQVPICLDNLGDLDSGHARAVVDAAIRLAAADLDDRGEDGKPRQVNIILSMVKMDNGLTAVHIEAESKLPRRRTHSTLAQVKQEDGQAQLMFQTLAPGEPTQRTIDEAERKARGEV